MRKLIFALTLLCVTVSFSQSKPFNISGKVFSVEENIALEAATVYLEKAKDSSLVTYTISDKNGGFELIEDTSEKNLNLYISYVGYKTYKKAIPIDKEKIDLGTINLEVSTNSLSEVLITTEAPVTIKKDTLEFNVKSFKTKKDATVEDLLKELPGVEIDEEGKITVNGKEVNKILVNGKPFFGNDPSITTKNLTKDIIEKIQVVDTKSKSDAFAGKKSDGENKTINLTIKEENNKGVFGRLSAGAGTDKRYEFAGMFNRFDNDQRFSVLVGGNNTNSPGFSFGEINEMFGNSGGGLSFNSNGSFRVGGRSFGGGEGITTSRNIGANYADDFGKSADLSTDYFYSESNSNNESSTQRETILVDSRFFSNSRSRSDNETASHSANLDFEVEIDSTFQINIAPSFGRSKTASTFSSNDETLDENLQLTNLSSLSTVSENRGNSFSNKVDFTKRFGAKGGAFLTFGFGNSFNKTESEDYLNSNTEVFGNIPETIVRNQFTSGKNKSNGFDSYVAYRVPLVKKKWFLDLNYDYSRNKDQNIKSTFDQDETSGQFDTFNNELSTDFEYTDIKSKPGATLRYENKKWNTSLTTSYVFRTLENQDILRPEFNVKRDFKALEMRYSLRYSFSTKASLSTSYSLTNTPPALRQLQAFQDVSNPLNVVVGNPNLEPSNNHRVNLSFNSFDWQKRTGIFAYSYINFKNNATVSKTTVDLETLKRTTTYENVDGGYDGSLSLTYSKRIKIDSVKSVRLRASTWGSFSKNINFNNDVKYASNVINLTPSLGIDFVWKKVFEFKPRYRITFTNNTFDIDAFEDRNFLRHRLSLKTATFLPKNLDWRNDINYEYNPNVADGFQKSSWFWNSSIAYSMLKDKGLLTLKVYDLLDQNTNARRTASQDFIQDSQSTVLQQYFMLSFSWKFNSLGAKGNRGGGNVIFFD